MEGGPHEAGNELADTEQIGREMLKRCAQGEHGDQDEDQLACVHVAEQSQRQRQRTHRFLDDAQEQVEGREYRPERRSEPFLEESADALVLDADILDEKKHGNRHAEGRVDVGGRHHAQIMDARGSACGRQPVDRQHVHEIHQENETEDGQGKRRNQLAATMEGLAHHAIDKTDNHLDGALQLAGNAGGGATGNTQENPHEQHAGQQLENDAVDVEQPELAFGTGHLDLQMMQVVLDVLGHVGGRGFAGHRFT